MSALIRYKSRRMCKMFWLWRFRALDAEGCQDSAPADVADLMQRYKLGGQVQAPGLEESPDEGSFENVS